MTDFTRDYWNQQREVLDTSDETRHVDFARFVADHCGNRVKHIARLGWFRWNGKVWEQTDGIGAAMQAITDASHILTQHGMDDPGDYNWSVAAASKLRVHRERRAIAAEMEFLPQLAADVNDLDAQRHLLTFQNGTVDLRIGALLPHHPQHMLTQMTNVDYDPEAAAPRWERFIQEIFPGNEDLQRYYLRFLGMCITGEVKDHALGVWYGSHGRNGKGATVRTMKAVFGEQIIKDVPFQTFELVRGQQVHTEVIAGMRGARMVVAQEGNPDAPMNTALLKTLSGGDAVPARHLHGKTFEYQPTFTLVLATNHLPQFSSGGAALWARTKAILFGESFADRVDFNLEPTIQGPEREGVAASIVRGAVEYYRNGLSDPLDVVAATEFHRDSVDPLKELVGELFEYHEGSSVKRGQFNSELKTWRENNGDKGAKFSPSSVKRHLIDSGKVTEVRTKADGWTYQGVYLMSSPPADLREAAGPGIFGTN